LLNYYYRIKNIFNKNIQYFSTFKSFLKETKLIPLQAIAQEN